MDLFRKDFFRVSAGLLAGIIAAAILFAGLPMLTQVYERKQDKSFENPIMLMAHKPPKAPPPEKERMARENAAAPTEPRTYR